MTCLSGLWGLGLLTIGDDLEQLTFISYSSGGWESKIKVLLSAVFSFSGSCRLKSSHGEVGKC